jgi:hypothetical protein
MSVEQYAVRQGGLFVAKVDIPDSNAGRIVAHRDAMHYMAVYGQDGPVQLWYRSKWRKWKPLTGNGYTVVSTHEVDRMRRAAIRDIDAGVEGE